MIPFVKKYNPKQAEDVVGQDQALRLLDLFLKKGRGSAILFGPIGCGKTSSVYALASQFDYEILEINASDFRNKAVIESVIGSAIGQMSLFAKSKIILIDEIDGLAGREDRGGVAALVRIIKDSRFPIVMTANNVYEQKLKSVRKASDLIEFKEVDPKDMKARLEFILKQENIPFNDRALTSLCVRSGGDLRSAINDVQTIAGDRKKIDQEGVDALGERETTISIPQALVRVLKTKDPSIALGAFDNVQEDVDQVFLWMDENMPKEYTDPEDRYKAYVQLSNADRMRRRIRRRQHWRFLSYIYQYLSAGVAVAKKEKYKTFTQYKQTMRLLRIWQANMKWAKRKSICQKIANSTHSSTKEVMQDTFPYIKIVLANNQKMCNDLDISADEVAWLKKIS